VGFVYAVLIFLDVVFQKVDFCLIVSLLSVGEYITLGLKEKSDLKVVIDYLRSFFGFSRLVLWGRSMVWILVFASSMIFIYNDE
jgi:hypothetical protein